MLIRVAAYYICIFGALGALLPFLPVVLERRTFTPTQVGWILVVMPLGDMLIPPVWGFIADRFRARRVLLGATALGSGLTVWLLAPKAPLLATMGLLGLFCVFRSAVVPLGDATTRALLAERAHNYGLIRVWGSIAFGLAALATGWLEAGPRAVFGVASGLYLVGALVGWTLPHTTPPPRPGLGRAALREITRPLFLIFLVGTTCYYAGHAIYDAYVSLHLLKLGFSERFVGGAWALGVAGESALLFVTPWLLKRFSPAAMLRVCAAVAALRWLFLAFVDDPTWILVLQPVHAVTFGLWYVCGVYLTQALAPDDLRSTLQAAMVAAIGSGRVIGYLSGGPVLQHFGGSQVFQLAAAAATLALGIYVLLAWLTRRETQA